MNNKTKTLFILISALIALSGCGNNRMAYNQRHFVLEASRSSQQHKTSKDIILDVKNFRIDTPFSTKSLVYRKGKSEYETDFYNQFLVMPEDMITEKARIWLSESGLFKWVLEPGSYTDATHILEGNITALYGDFRSNSLPKANMKISIFLVDLSDKSVVFTNTYEAVSEFKDRTAESLIEAFNDCLTKILSGLENDLARKS